MNMPVIQINKLVFSYSAASKPCLDINEFSIAKGERVFLYGPSGSGKSTLLGILGGVLVAQQGNIQLLGQDLTAMKSSARDKFRADHIGFLFQQFNLIPYLSVFDNVLLPCQFSSKRAANAVATGNTLRQEVERLS